MNATIKHNQIRERERSRDLDQIGEREAALHNMYIKEGEEVCV